MRCLVIEDEADTARYISNGLRTEGAEEAQLIGRTLLIVQDDMADQR